MKGRMVAVLCAVVLLGAGTSQAALLGITKLEPDINVSSDLNLICEYDASSDLFTASSSGDFQYDPDPPKGAPFETISNATFSLTATIDSAGNLSSGSFTIFGDTGDGNELQLSGNLTALGSLFGSSFLSMDATFDTTGGDLVSDYGPKGGMILSFFDTSIVGFSDDFESKATTFLNSGDVFYQPGVGVPEPATLALMGLGGVAFVGARRRRMTTKA